MKVSTETLARFERLLHVPGVVRKRKKFVREEKSLETRRELLAVSFGNLPPRTDLDRVYRILERAKRAEAESFIEGFKIDQRRKLRKAQEKYSLLLRQLNALREKLLPGIEPLTDSLGFERVEWSGPIRRARPGHQEEPWLRVARKEFSVLKVPRLRIFLLRWDLHRIA